MEENLEILEEMEIESEEEEVQLPEALFRVETTLNAAIQKEASETVRGKLPEILYWVFIAMCVGLFAVLLWQQLSQDRNQIPMLVVAGFALVLALYHKLVASKRALKRWEENLIRQCGSDSLHLTTEFFERSLCQSVKETGDSLVEGYSSIDSMKESEHLFLLRCGRQQWFFVEKAGFADGTPEAFRRFISEKIGG